MELGPHANFILAAYAISALVLGAVILWVIADYRAQRQIIRDLEARTPKRK
jgi:heme exporter protein D